MLEQQMKQKSKKVKKMIEQLNSDFEFIKVHKTSLKDEERMQIARHSVQMAREIIRIQKELKRKLHYLIMQNLIKTPVLIPTLVFFIC